MRLTALPFIVFLTACYSQDSQLDGGAATDFVHNPSSESDTTVLASNNDTSQHLVIRWPAIKQSNPFSTDLIFYELWHNDQHIDTVRNNSYVLSVDTTTQSKEDNLVCVRLRAIRGTQKSALSDPACYPVPGA